MPNKPFSKRPIFRFAPAKTRRTNRPHSRNRLPARGLASSQSPPALTSPLSQTASNAHSRKIFVPIREIRGRPPPFAHSHPTPLLSLRPPPSPPHLPGVHQSPLIPSSPPLTDCQPAQTLRKYAQSMPLSPSHPHLPLSPLDATAATRPAPEPPDGRPDHTRYFPISPEPARPPR